MSVWWIETKQQVMAGKPDKNARLPGMKKSGSLEDRLLMFGKVWLKIEAGSVTHNLFQNIPAMQLL